jgi:DNA-binding CsgD family transcriptional regulator
MHSLHLRQQLLEFIENSNAAKSPEEVLNLYRAAVSDYGFDKLNYSNLRSMPSAASTFTAHTLPLQAVEEYRLHLKRDPVAVAAIHAHGPMTWEQVLATTPDAEFSRWAQEHRLLDGVCVPLHGPRGEVLGIGLASSMGGTDSFRHLRILNLLSVQFDVSYRSLARAPPSPKFRLTPREIEILKWCSAGKSNWEISEIIAVSAHTVDFHLRNIFLKLDVHDRTRAVLVAAITGLIEF